MKISIVMATYNGERYVKEQIESLFNQTRPADEVLIFDDGSTDDTRQIIEGFIHINQLESKWQLIKNTTNKGCVKNFLDGAEKASGDIIFYSDQDDVWDTRKIELMEQGFYKYPDMKACYCLRYYVDANMNAIPMRFEFMTNVKKRSEDFQKISLREAVKYNKSPGLCLAVKKELISETRSLIIDNGLTHDLPIGTVAAVYDGYYVLIRKLVYYRQHGKNLSAARIDIQSRLSRIDEQIQGRQVRYKQMVAIYEKYSKVLSDDNAREFRRAISDTEESISCLKNRRLGKLFLALFNTNPMMNRWIAVNNFLACIRSK